MATDYFDLAVDLARRQGAEAQPPTEQDHRLAEYRFVYLCDRCGTELRYPGEAYQLCAACEEKENAVPPLCVVCMVEPIDEAHAPTCGSNFCREGWDQDVRR